SVLVAADALGSHKGSITADIVKKVNPDSITLVEGLCLVAVVGRGMVNTEGTAARVFTALANAKVNVRMIDQGSSEINIIVAVDEKDYHATLEAIYKEFVK
ncbi:MAG: ACT domain-containing protein, partial [Oscillospiraceae bacterium]|nr:ACT domain-containing protein [Oscillospiraceae bacterium]